MNRIEIQAVYDSPGQPDSTQLQTWIDAALQDYEGDTEIVVRIVDELESAALNSQYRHKNGATNILSFPADLPDDFANGLGYHLLGDLVICAPVLEQEAQDQAKLLHHHWAHIVIHGVLHLVGYDHIDDQDADTMEAKEIEILSQLAINNPYLTTAEL